MKNLYHPILKITAEDLYSNDPAGKLWKCNEGILSGVISEDIKARKALGFIYPAEGIADDLMEYLNGYNRTKEEIIKIIEKYI